MSKRSYRYLWLGALALAGCGESPQAPDKGEKSPIQSPFDALRVIHDALEQSPDNLPARARALIRAKDPDAIFRFVRDEIAVYPPPELGSSQQSQLFGVRGTLRGGAGTPRDRAELLSWMLREAGFEASVVAGAGPDATLSPEAERAIYLRTIPREFMPADPPAPLTWGDLVVPDDEEPRFYDPDGTESLALSDALGELIPASAAAPVPFIPRDPLPLVAVEVNGVTTYANPMYPEAAFGEAHAPNPAPAESPEGLPDVKVTLAIARSDAPTERIDVATTTIALDELIGRQILVRLQSALPTQTLLGSRLDDSQVFVPVLAMTGADLSDDDAAQHAVVGSLLTRSGNVVEETSDGSLLFDGVPFDLSATDSSAAARVAELSMEINANDFPQIELSARPSDAAGDAVPGLSAKAFSLVESGTDLQLVMRQNGGDFRVLFLLDKTLSQPPLFFDEATAGELGRSLGEALFGAVPTTHAEVAVLDGPAPTIDGFTITTTDALSAAFQSPPGPGVDSPIFHAVRAAQRAQPNLIVLFTDGVDPTSAAEADGVLGDIPVLVVGCSADPATIDQDVLDHIASLSGGATVDAGTLDDAAEVNAAMVEIAERRAQAPYRFWYRAKASGPSTREVTLSAGTAQAEGSYRLPAAPVSSREVSGVYLTVDIGGTEVHRTLAGWDSDRAPSAEVPPEALDEVRSFFFGGALLSFEGGPPTISEWMDDMVTAQLRTEPIYEAAIADDKAAFVEALESTAGFAIPAEVAAAHSPLPRPEGTVVYEPGPRVVLYRFAPSEVETRHVDILPFTRFRTLGAVTEADTFRTTLRASAGLALAEKAMFPTSTASLLEGTALTFVAPGFVDDQALGAFPSEERSRFAEILNRYTTYDRLIASDGSTLAFWAIDPGTGTLLGVLPDGTGGGNAACGGAGGSDRYFELLELLNDYLEIPELSVWVVLGKFVGIAAVEAALCFTDIGPDPRWGDDPLGSFACGEAANVFSKYIGGAIPGSIPFQKFTIGQAKEAVGKKIAGGFGNCPPIVPKGC